MAGDLVLITGATGYLGFRTLRYALEHGYRVRAAVRSESKAEIVKNNAVLRAMSIPNDQLSFIVVPDFSAPNAYDEALKDVKYVLHIASPPPQASTEENFEKDIVEPAIRGTIGILEAAQKAGTIKRIVITSSVVAIAPLSALADPASQPKISAESRIPEAEPPYGSPFAAYAKSKAAALNRAEAWVQKEKPGFDLIHIYPSYILGRNDLTTTLEDIKTDTNRYIFDMVTGSTNLDPLPANTNHVDDAAWVHVRSLDPKIAGNQSFLVSNSGEDGQEWNHANEIVARRFPEAVKNGTLSTTGHRMPVAIPLDVKKTEETFGFKFASFESQVVSAVEHYLEVWEKEKEKI